jgi:hypothetical protein
MTAKYKIINILCERLYWKIYCQLIFSHKNEGNIYFYDLNLGNKNKNFAKLNKVYHLYNLLLFCNSEHLRIENAKG